MNKNTENKNTAEISPEAYLEELVSIKLFRDGGRYRDNVYVAVNGQNCIIKRGEWVKVKRKFAMVLDASEIQDMKTAQMIEAEEEKFRTAEAKLA
ncbi:MAG: hypothetical protein E7589_02080 [Ruminococcaceae bacterium]|nr:hypothetical protein [Oscillospiraceae bacterium]